MNRLIVGMADCRVSSDPASVLITYALGSCIGLAVQHAVSRVGGLLDFMLPDSGLDAARAGENPYRAAQNFLEGRNAHQRRSGGWDVARTLRVEIGSGRFFLRASGESDCEMLPSRFAREKSGVSYVVASPNC